MGRAASWGVVGVGALFYLTAFFLPVLNPFSSLRRPMFLTGADAFQVGWRAITSWEPAERDWWLLSAAWLANPAIWIALIATGCGCWRVACVAAACALAGCLTPLVLFRTAVAHAGYFLWVQSAALLLGASVLALYRGRRRQR